MTCQWFVWPVFSGCAVGRIPCIYFYSRNIACVDSLQSPFQCLGAWGISIPHKMNIPAARGCTRPRHYSWIIASQWWLKGPGSGCLSPFQWSTLEGLQAHVIPLGLLPLLCLNFSMPARLHAPRAGARKKPNIPCSWIITLGTQSLSLEGGCHLKKDPRAAFRDLQRSSGA